MSRLNDRWNSHRLCLFAARAYFRIVSSRIKLAIESRGVDGRFVIFLSGCERFNRKLGIADRLGCADVFTVCVKDRPNNISGDAFVRSVRRSVGSVQLNGLFDRRFSERQLIPDL